MRGEQASPRKKELERYSKDDRGGGGEGGGQPHSEVEYKKIMRSRKR
jgi:hypothetical protein